MILNSLGCRQQGECVADGIDVRISEAEFGEAVEEPGGARGFAEGRRRNGKNLHEPAAQLRLVQMQPVERAMHSGVRGELRNAEIGGRGHR